MRPAIFLRLLLLTFTEGGAVMVAELIAGMMVAPFYGNTIISWAVVLAVSLGGLAGGYYLGGRLSRSFSVDHLLRIFIFSGGFFLIIMPFWAGFVMKQLMDFSIQTGLIVSLLAFLFPAMLSYGTISPLLIQKVTENKTEAGQNTGTIYGISTLGGILCTLSFGLWVIPEWGLREPTIITGSVVLLIGALVLFGKKKWISLTAVGVFVLLLWQQNKSSLKVNPPSRVQLNMLHHSEGVLGQVKVMDHGWKTRTGKKVMARSLLVNNTWQTAVTRQNGNSILTYVYYMLPLIKEYPANSKMLVVGLGGGGLVNEIQRAGYKPDMVELDKRLVGLSSRYFGVNPAGKMVVDDGRHFINASKKKYDVVILDVFQGEVPPWQMLTKECFQKIRKMLRPGGKLMIEFFGNAQGKGATLPSVYKTLQEAGLVTQVIDVRKHENILVAAEKEVDLKNLKYANPLAGAQDSTQLSKWVLDSVQFQTENAVVLTDNLPRLETMVLQSSLEWRRYQNSIFRDQLMRYGFPVFY